MAVISRQEKQQGKAEALRMLKAAGMPVALSCVSFYHTVSGIVVPAPRLEIMPGKKQRCGDFFDGEYYESVVGVMPFRSTLPLVSKGSLPSDVKKDFKFTIAHEVFHHVQRERDFEGYKAGNEEIVCMPPRRTLMYNVSESGAHAFALAYLLRWSKNTDKARDEVSSNPTLAYSWIRETWYGDLRSPHEAAIRMYNAIKKHGSDAGMSPVDSIAATLRVSGPSGNHSKSHGAGVAMLYLALVANEFDLRKTLGVFDRDWLSSIRELSLLFRSRRVTMQALRDAFPSKNLS